MQTAMTILFVFLMITLALGVIAVFFCAIYFLKYRKHALLVFGGLSLSLLFILTTMSLTWISQLTGIPYTAFMPVVTVLSFGSIGFFNLCLPLMVHLVLGIRVKRLQRYAYPAWTLVCFVVYFLMLTVRDHAELLSTLNSWMMWITTAYVCTLGLVHIRRVPSLYLRTPIVAFFVISVVHFIATMAMVPFRESDLYLVWIFQDSLHGLYFLLLFSGTIAVGVKYFLNPPCMENGKPSDFFLQAHDLTKREAEILGLMLDGLSNPGIAEKLFIAPKTVENHISSIYRKTGTKNRYHLISLMYAQN